MKEEVEFLEMLLDSYIDGRLVIITRAEDDSFDWKAMIKSIKNELEVKKC